MAESGRRYDQGPIVFTVFKVLAVAHLFRFYNLEPLADVLEVPHQQSYTESSTKPSDTIGEPISTFPSRRFYIEFSKFL
jgi:hypothetical protein